MLQGKMQSRVELRLRNFTKLN